ncbi:MAG: hypothetical protein HKN49_10300 [Gammaproteobacteria bacterium]|nr:hypothetical protein [Gammaproteobacteria bacterium]
MIWPFKRQAGDTAQAGVVVDEFGAAVAVVQRRGHRLCLRHWGRAAGPDAASQLLDDAAVPVVAVLQPDHYQMLLVERPDVPDPEVAAAVRWRVRDLLNFPVDEATLDVFDVPAQARGNRMVYAVAAPQSRVAEFCQPLDGLGLAAVDIIELCVRNLAVALPQDRFGVACLLISGSHGFLTISRDRQVYLIRQMEVPEAAASDPAAASQIALELQRSLDYFESHYDQRPIRDVVLAPSLSAPSLAAMLGQEMAVNVSLLDLNELVEAPREMTMEEQCDCVLALGAALRGPDRLEQAA